MNDLFYFIGIPLAVYVVVRLLDSRFQVHGDKRILVMACLLFSLAMFLPSPPIHGQDTQFFTHFFGGGVFCGLLWLYFGPIRKTQAWYVELLWLYGIVSSLGVLNELYELTAYELHIIASPVTDTSWDLLANTLGMLLFYGVYQMFKRVKT